MGALRLTHVGGPTVLIETQGWRILTDPTFDPPGRTYYFPWPITSRKVGGPAVKASDLGPIDVLLLSHDQHKDALDDAGRELLASVPTIVTTESGARRLRRDRRLRGEVQGLDPWGRTSVSASGRPTLRITATPCRHGPPALLPFVGDVIGFAVRWQGQDHGRLWVSGDTVLFDDLRRIVERIGAIDVAIVHVGRARFTATWRARYTMGIEDAVELGEQLRVRTVVPVHYEGWSHFRQGRQRIEQELEQASDGAWKRVKLLAVGVATTLSTI